MVLLSESQKMEIRNGFLDISYGIIDPGVKRSLCGWRNLMEGKITILCENTVGHLIGWGEHGFSAFVETDQGNYLFDTGSGHSIVANSLLLNKDLRSIKRIFLSVAVAKELGED